MTSGQRIAVSLFTSILLFCAVAVAAFAGLFSIVETHFYQPVVERSISKKIEDVAFDENEYFSVLEERFSNFSEDTATVSYLSQKASQAEIKDRTEKTGNLFAETLCLKGIRIVDANGRHLHYSSYSSDVLKKNANSVTYKNYTDLGVEPFETFKEKITVLSEKDLFVFSFTLKDAGEKSAKILFYCGSDDFSKYLVSKKAITLSNNAVLMKGGGFLLSMPSVGEKIIQDAVLEKWSAFNDETSEIENATEISNVKIEKLVSTDESDFILAYTKCENGLFVGEIFEDAILVFPNQVRIMLLILVFTTIFLIIFFIFSLKRDDMTVIQDRIRKFQLSFIKEYISLKGTDEKVLKPEQISARKTEINSEIKKNLGRRGKKHSAEVDELLENSWEDILGALGAKKNLPISVQGGINKDDLRSILEEIISRSNFNVNVVASEVAPVVKIEKAATVGAEKSPVKKSKPVPETKAVPIEKIEVVEEAEPVEEIEEVVEVEELEEIEEVEAVEELEEIEDAEPIEEIETLEEVEPAAEVDEPEEIEEVEEVEEVEELEEIEDAEPVEELEELEEIEEVEPVEELEDLEEVEPVNELEEVEDAEPIEELDEVEEIEPVEELEELEDVEPDEELEEVEEIESEEIEEIEDVFADDDDEAGIAAELVEDEVVDVVEAEENDSEEEPLEIEDEMGEIPEEIEEVEVLPPEQFDEVEPMTELAETEISNTFESFEENSVADETKNSGDGDEIENENMLRELEEFSESPTPANLKEVDAPEIDVRAEFNTDAVFNEFDADLSTDKLDFGAPTIRIFATAEDKTLPNRFEIFAPNYSELDTIDGYKGTAGIEVSPVPKTLPAFTAEELSKTVREELEEFAAARKKDDDECDEEIHHSTQPEEEIDIDAVLDNIEDITEVEEIVEEIEPIVEEAEPIEEIEEVVEAEETEEIAEVETGEEEIEPISEEEPIAEPEPVVDEIPVPEPIAEVEIVEQEPEPIVEEEPIAEPEPIAAEISVPEPEPIVSEISVPEPEPIADEIPVPEPESVVPEIASAPEPLEDDAESAEFISQNVPFGFTNWIYGGMSRIKQFDGENETDVVTSGEIEPIKMEDMSKTPEIENVSDDINVNQKTENDINVESDDINGNEGESKVKPVTGKHTIYVIETHPVEDAIVVDDDGVFQINSNLNVSGVKQDPFLKELIDSVLI